MRGSEATGEVGEVLVGGLRLIGEPVVDQADPSSDEQSDTAELPTPAQVAAALAVGEDDPIVAPAGSGLRSWAERVRGVLRGCGRPLLAVAALCAGPMYLFAGRVADSVVAAPVLSEMARGVGLLLLPLMWLSYLALGALPLVLCLAGVTAVIVSWATDGARPDLRTALGATLHRVGPLWAWLGVVDAVVQLMWLLPDDAAGPWGGPLLSLCVAVAFAGFTVLMGVLGCVVLFERGRALSRAWTLLTAAPRGPVAGLGVVGLALIELPELADQRWGAGAAALIVVPGALLWAVAAVVTYAQARRVQGPLTSARLRAELSA